MPSEAAGELASRIRALIGHQPGVTETRMFGGFGFMLYGNMVAGATKTGSLLARVGSRYEEALLRPGAHPMQMGSREMKGFVEVTDEGIDTDEALRDWLTFSEAFVKTLPPKT